MEKRSNILLIVLKSRKTVPDAAQPKQLSEEAGGGNKVWQKQKGQAGSVSRGVQAGALDHSRAKVT